MWAKRGNKITLKNQGCCVLNILQFGKVKPKVNNFLNKICWFFDTSHIARKQGPCPHPSSTTVRFSIIILGEENTTHS